MVISPPFQPVPHVVVEEGVWPDELARGGIQRNLLHTYPCRFRVKQIIQLRGL